MSRQTVQTTNLKIQHLVVAARVSRGRAGCRLGTGLQSTCYGVTAEDAGRSGLPAVGPSGGLEHITGRGAAIYPFNKNWLGGAMIYCQRLTGSAPDSPIVAQRSAARAIRSRMASAWPMLSVECGRSLF
ncbi:MipA/OmpV family protein [Paraburkholderia sediminicola]|uniref:MipA/OmpV family protein n=1 Tax=Paraburkholderia metrosideri TaxID=580937 RepID=A0ABW9E350_9BURK